MSMKLRESDFNSYVLQLPSLIIIQRIETVVEEHSLV